MKKIWPKTPARRVDCWGSQLFVRSRLGQDELDNIRSAPQYSDKTPDWHQYWDFLTFYSGLGPSFWRRRCTLEVKPWQSSWPLHPPLEINASIQPMAQAALLAESPSFHSRRSSSKPTQLITMPTATASHGERSDDGVMATATTTIHNKGGKCKRHMQTLYTTK